jgi:hypothetical protein
MNQCTSTVKIERDELNDMFESIIEINDTQSIEKNVHCANPTVNFNDDCPTIDDDCSTVSEQLHNEKNQYQCNICYKELHDKYNLEVHKLFHAYIKKFECTTCGVQFLDLGDLKSHLISHIDHNIQLIENQFVQQERNRIDVDECNSNLWYAKL